MQMKKVVGEGKGDRITQYTLENKSCKEWVHKEAKVSEIFEMLLIMKLQSKTLRSVLYYSV